MKNRAIVIHLNVPIISQNAMPNTATYITRCKYRLAGEHLLGLFVKTFHGDVFDIEPIDCDNCKVQTLPPPSQAKQYASSNTNQESSSDEDE